MVILAIQRSILVSQGLRPDEFFTLPRHAWTGTWRFYHFETMISIKSNISDTHMEEKVRWLQKDMHVDLILKVLGWTLVWGYLINLF